MPIYTHDTLPVSSQDAIQAFEERYLALSLVKQPDTWCERFGAFDYAGATSTKYLMNMMALKFQATKDTAGRFKTIGERSIDLKVEEHDEGVEIELINLLLNTSGARAWAKAPERFLQAESNFRCLKIASMLEANSALCGWDDLTLFNDSHLANPANASVGTFDNLQASAKDVTNMTHLEEEVALMMEVKDENGDKLGVMPDAVLVPTAKFAPLANKMKQDLIANSAGTATIRNPYADGTIEVVHVPQLTDANDFYLVDSKLIAAGAEPWVASVLALADARFSALGMRVFDESSDRFKQTGKIAISKHTWNGFGFMFPHAIRKVSGA